MKEGPHTDSVGYFFIKICKTRRNKANEMLAKYGIHAGQDVLLYYLSLEDGQTVSQLATDIHIQHATISNMINRMVATDLVEKVKDKKDARVSRIFLTEKGKEAVVQLKKVWQILEGKTLDGLTDDEIIMLKKLLKKVLANFEI